MPTNETKKDNFIRLAENRTNKIIDMLELLGNLSNKANYIYSEEQVNKIFDTIENEIKKQRNRFNSSGEQKRKKFRL